MENEGLIRKIINRYRTSFDPKIYEDDDLLQMCRVKMLETGFKSYDETKGVKLSTWAVTLMEQKLLEEIKKNRQQKRNCGEILSLDGSNENFERSESLINAIAVGKDGEGYSIEHELIVKEDIEALYRSLKVLTAEERFIFQHLLGIGISDEEMLTQVQIAKLFDQSQPLISATFERCKIKIMRELKARNAFKI